MHWKQKVCHYFLYGYNEILNCVSFQLDYILPTSTGFAEQIALVIEGALLVVPYDNETNHYLTIVLQTAKTNADNQTIYTVIGAPYFLFECVELQYSFSSLFFCLYILEYWTHLEDTATTRK